MPKIKEILNSKLGEKLGTHMNGDDSSALGLAFLSANLTNMFLPLKKVYLSNYGTSYEIKLKIIHGEENEEFFLPLCSDEFNGLAIDCIRKVSKEAPIFRPRYGFDVNRVVNFKHDSDFTIKIFEKFNNENDNYENQISTYKVKGLSKRLIPLLKKEKGFSGNIPKVSLKFSMDKVGILSLKAELLYEIVSFLKYDKDSKGNYDFKYIIDKVEPIPASQLIDEISKINSNKNFTKTEKDKIIKKLKEEVGTNRTDIRKKELEVTMEYIHPLPITKAGIIKSKVKLNNFDKIDNDRLLIVERRNILEGLFYDKNEWTNSEESRLYAKSEEIVEFKKNLQQFKEWYDENGFKVDLETINGKINEVNDLYNIFHYRMEIHKKRNIAVEYFISEMKSILKDAHTVVQTKYWIDDYLRNNFTEKYKLYQNWLKEQSQNQDKIFHYEEPVLTEEAIYHKLDQMRSELARMKRIPKPQDTTLINNEENIEKKNEI